MLSSIILLSLMCFGVNTSTALPHYKAIENHITYNALMMTNNTRKSEITDYLGKVMCNLFTPIIYVYHEYQMETDLVRDLMMTLNECKVAPIQIFRIGQTQLILNDDGIEMYLVVVLNDHNHNYQRTLSFLQKKSAEKHRSCFFIVFEKPVLPGEWIEDIFNQFWSHHILNVVIIFWSTERNVYTFNPFFDDYHLKLPSNLTNAKELFYDKLSNQNGRELQVSLFHEEVKATFEKSVKLLVGPDAFLSYLLRQKMNATFKFLAPADNKTYGQYFSNGSSTGALQDVVTERVNFSINSRYYIYQELLKNVEVSITNGQDDLCFLVPKRSDGSHLANMFKSFEKPVWIAVVTSIFAMAIIWTCIQSLQHSSPNIHQIFMDLYRCNFGQPILRSPAQLSAKFMVIFWMLYCLLITSSFKGNLTSSLALPTALSDINTIRDLVEADLKILVDPKLNKYLQINLDSMKTDHTLLINNIVEVSEQEFFKSLNSNNVSVGFANKNHLTTFWAAKKDHTTVEGRPLYHAMQECPVPYLITYIFPYGSPLVGKFNKILRQTQEAGLWSLWEKLMEQLHHGSGKKMHFHKQSHEEFQQLKMYHLQAAFYILLIGLLISSIVFCGEQWVYRKENMRRNKKIVKVQLYPFVN